MNEYEVEIGGLTHTVKLSDEDAKLRGATPVQKAQTKQAEQPANKAKSADNK